MVMAHHQLTFKFDGREHSKRIVVTCSCRNNSDWVGRPGQKAPATMKHLGVEVEVPQWVRDEYNSYNFDKPPRGAVRWI
jgi:hypothetical protein